MSSINKVILVGYVGNDPDVRTAGSSQVATFSLATNEKWKDKEGHDQEKTEWHRVVVWGKMADVVGKYVKKGKQVYVEGKNQTRNWEDKDGVKRYTTEIVASTVQFLGSAESGARPPHPADQQQQDAGQPPAFDSSEEIPL
jgi:single-strand DNA-binding protein